MTATELNATRDHVKGIPNPAFAAAPGLLTGKRILVTGIATADSIAFAVAAQAQRLGAHVIISAHPRDVARCEDAVSNLPQLPAAVLPVDATSEADIERLVRAVDAEADGLDGVLHAIAFAPQEALLGMASASSESVELAFRSSVFTYVALSQALARTAPASGGSLVGLDFDAAGAWPVYNWMGVCKAALESASRYLARDLGPRGIRSNLVAAGPLHTRAASAIPGFSALLEAWTAQAPLTWDAGDPTPTAHAVCFLLSDLARAITGEILHVDGGYHAMSAPLAP